MKKTILTILLTCAVNINYPQTFTVKDTGTFVPQKKKVVLLHNSLNNQIVLFKTNLQVNTDGAPNSYHPYDLRGDSIALNSILNAVGIYRKEDNIEINLPDPGKYSKAERNEMAREAYTIFEKWRDSNFDSLQPTGYKIIWKNVLIPDKNNKPCIFSNGIYKGYFASAIALKNDLKTDKGECDCNDQVNPLEIPTLVLAGGNNVVKKFGASRGDLVVAYNLTNKNIVYAVIGDAGPPKNLGEASVILNMKLKGIDKFPRRRKDTYGLATNKDILVCIIPKSKLYKIDKPYTQKNIHERILSWFKEQGYDGENKIMDLFEMNRILFN